MRERVVATTHYNIDRHGARARTGTFDPGEFAKLLRDFEEHRAAGGWLISGRA